MTLRTDEQCGCAHEPLRYLTRIGMWGDARSWMRRYSPPLALAQAVYGLLAQTINVAQTWGKMALAAEFCVSLLQMSMTVIKISCLLVNAGQIQEAVTTLDEMRMAHARTDDVTHIVRRTRAWSDKFASVMHVVCSWMLFIATFLTAVAAYLEREIPYRRWYPHDITASPAFELTLLSFVPLIIFDYYLILLFDLLFFCLLIEVIGEFKVLQHRLTHVLDRPWFWALRHHGKAALKQYGNVALKQHGNMALKQYGNVALKQNGNMALKQHGNVALKQYGNLTLKQHGNAVLKQHGNVAKKIHGNVALKSHGNVGVIGVGKPSHFVRVKPQRRIRLHRPNLSVALLSTVKQRIPNAPHETTEQRLAACVVHHQMLIRLVSNLEAAFQPGLVIHLVCNVCVGLTLAYSTLKVDGITVKTVNIALVGLICISEFGFYCFFCTQLTTESTRVREALYACAWWEASASFKRSLRIVQLRTNRPLVIRAVAIFSMSMETFTKVMHSAYKLYGLMITTN